MCIYTFLTDKHNFSKIFFSNVGSHEGSWGVLGAWRVTMRHGAVQGREDCQIEALQEPGILRLRLLILPMLLIRHILLIERYFYVI